MINSGMLVHESVSSAVNSQLHGLVLVSFREKVSTIYLSFLIMKYKHKTKVSIWSSSTDLTLVPVGLAPLP